MNLKKIILILLSLLTLISASFTICRIIPTTFGITATLLLICCELTINAVKAYKKRAKATMIGYGIAAATALFFALYNVFA